MNSPAERQESEKTEKSMNEALADAFDEMLEGDDDVTDVEEEEIEETEETSEGEETEETEGEETQETQTTDEAEYNEPAPERWPAEMREAYSNLPASAKKALMENVFKPMQRQYGETTTNLANMRKAIEPMVEAMNQHRADFERMGMNPVEAFRTQIAWAAHLSRVGPEQGLRDMRAAYGLDKPKGQENEGYLTPQERALKAKVDELEKKFGTREQQEQHRLQAQAQESAQQRYNEVQQGLQSFITEQKDGKPAHPHVERVASQIAGIIRGGLVNRFDESGRPVPVREQLKSAYRMACDLDPSLRSAVQNTRQTAKAKASQSVNVVSKNTGGKEFDDNIFDLKSSVEDTYDKLSKRRTG